MRLFLTGAVCLFVTTAAHATSFSGKVSDEKGEPLAGAFVSARDTTNKVTYSVATKEDGTYELASLPDVRYALTAHAIGYAGANGRARKSGEYEAVDFTLQPVEDVSSAVPPFAFLATLPDGDEKRRLAIDCLGCHALDHRTVYNEGRVRTEHEYKSAVDKMLMFAGANTPFPVMSPERDAEKTAAFLATHLTDQNIARSVDRAKRVSAPGGGYHVTEWDLPEQKDFPHDLKLDADGGVLVTGMFSGTMYRLDPESGEFTTSRIEPPGGNPRALDLASDGDWWVLGGMSRTLSRYRVATGTWEHFDIEMYPHSTMIDAKGRVWFNGHFTKDPIKMGYVDPNASGDDYTRIIEVPLNEHHESTGSPIPYGLRVGPDGTVWSTELAGNRLIRYSPDSGEFKTWQMPTPHSGPRRLDVARDGTVWIPEFAAGKLARFDPEREKFTEYEFPTSNSLPYCARIDHGRGAVWISQCANDAIARFDLETEEIVEYRLPSQTAFIRHIDIDQASGDVWAAVSNSPGVQPRIVRVRLTR